VGFIVLSPDARAGVLLQAAEDAVVAELVAGALEATA